MALKLKKTENVVKKVLIYGLDGSGKSTFAEQYCEKHNLNPVVIDIDDTNFTSLRERCVDLELKNDIKAYNEIKATIKDPDMKEYDTIILDGVSNLLELLTPNSGGQSAYKVRADRWGSILRHLINSNKNLIFIGQIDMEVIFNDEFQSPKPIIKVNSIVNEKYKTIKEGNTFSSELVKYRGARDERPIKPQSKAVAKKEEIQDITPNAKELNIDSDDEISDRLQREISKIPKLKQAINQVTEDGLEVNRLNIVEALDNQSGMNEELLIRLIERLDKILG